MASTLREVVDAAKELRATGALDVELSIGDVVLKARFAVLEKPRQAAMPQADAGLLPVKGADPWKSP